MIYLSFLLSSVNTLLLPEQNFAADVGGKEICH